MIITNKTPSVLSLASVLLSVIVLTACSDEEKKQRPKQAHHVEVMTAEIRSVSHQQTISGTLEATISVRLYNEESGRIARLPYFEGDTIKKDTVVISLVDDLIRAELDKARAQRAQASIDLKRLKKLLPKKLTSEEEMARAKTAYDIATAEENLQRIRFERSQIKAPFNGVITVRNNEPGDAVSSNSHILSMIDPDKLRVKVQISERWIPLINLNDPVKVSIDALGDLQHGGHVSRIHPTIDPATRKGTLEIVLQPMPENAQAGQLARVQITTQAARRLVVPNSAIQHDMNGAYLYRVSAIPSPATIASSKPVTSGASGKSQAKNIAQRSPIEKGTQFGEWVEIISGASVGDKIIIKGFLGLRDKKTVKVVSARH